MPKVESGKNAPTRATFDRIVEQVAKLDLADATHRHNQRQRHKEIGDQMRDLRLEAGLSLRCVARYFKVSASFVSDMEHGHRNYAVKYINQFARLRLSV